MIITQDVIDRIRTLLNEVIPQGGTESDTHFTDLMIIEVASSADSINHALFLLWTQKAGLVQNGSEIKQITAGGESTVRYTKMEYLDMCVKTAGQYKALWNSEKSYSSAFISKPAPGVSLW